MLWPTPSPSSLQKVPPTNLIHDLERDLNTDHSQALLNTFDNNSRPTSPAPNTSAAAASGNLPSLNSPPRVLSPKISVDVFSPQQEPLSITPLRTPPESPVKSYRRDSFKGLSYPSLIAQSPESLNSDGLLNNLTSPPSSPTQPSTGAALPPKLSQSLADHPLFRGCTPDGIYQLASRMHIRHYHPQDHIIRRSEQSSAMFYVLRGTVKVVSHDNEATYYEIKENNFFGDVGVLYRVPRSMDILAKNRCTIAILSGDDLFKAMEQSPEMAKAIGYQTQERYQMYLKRRQSISARRPLDGGPGGPDQCQDDARSDNFAKSDVHSAIRKVPLFQSCSTEVIHLLSLNVEPRTYNLGETIIRRGEIGREMFFIASGVVEILSDDNLRVLARFHEGNFFGEIAVLLDVPRIANVKAVSEVEVFVLTKDNLQAVFQAVPGAAETITAEGHRLYKNWMLRNTLGTHDESMEEEVDEDALRSIEQGINNESLVSGGSSRPSLQKRLSQDSDSRRNSIQFTTEQDPFGLTHSDDDGQHTVFSPAISVLPMMDESPFERRRSSSSSSTTLPPSVDTVVGPFDEVRAPEQDSYSNFPQSSFEQGTSASVDSEKAMEPPVSRNPTIRGLLESNPKRRRASVAVWSQQDLLKLAEAAGAKASIDTTFTPATATNMATSTIPAVDDESPTRSSHRRRSSSATLLKNLAIKKRTGPATFQDLDENIVIRILNALPLFPLLKVRRVCKSWNNLILEHDDVLQDIDLSPYKKVVTDTVLIDLCTNILSRKPERATRVSLRDCFLVSNKGLMTLAANMPSVEDLDLHSCWDINDVGFRSLGVHCPELRSIDFSNCRKLGDETIFGLYPKEAMETFNQLSLKKHVDKVLGPYAEVQELEDTLRQDETSPDVSMDEAQVFLAHRPSMDKCNGQGSEQKSPLAMDIEFPRFDSEPQTRSPQSMNSTVVSGPRGCPLLSSLNLSYCKNLTDKSFIHLSLYASKQLEYLNLQRCTTITSDAFTSLDLANKKNVQQNYNKEGVNHNIPAHEGYNPLMEPCFPRLRELHLSDCTFLSDQAIVSLAPNMPRLQVVSLSFCCALTDIAIEALCESCLYLKKMDFSFCGSAVSDATLYQMARFDALEPGRHSLQELEIRGCVRVTERGIREVLNGCANLKKLNISSCSGIGSGGLSSPTTTTTTNPLEKQDDSKSSTETNNMTVTDSSVAHGPGGAWASLPNACKNSEMNRRMTALKKGKEWALAQQRPGLVIIV
ncbi:hypothetical protein BGZ46_002769 [Entomortierella lignicola]|nr:hypothetical protein BGZ46_002769 [Entomortierella lignicola]